MTAFVVRRRLLILAMAALVAVATVLASPVAFAQDAQGSSSGCKFVDKFKIKKNGKEVWFFKVRCVGEGEIFFPEEPPPGEELPPEEEFPPPGEELPPPDEVFFPPQSCKTKDRFGTKKDGREYFVFKVRCVFAPGEGPPDGEF